MSKRGTKKRQDIIEFITRFRRRAGFAPSVREIGDAVGLSSPASIHSHLRILESEGVLTRDKGRPRALTIADEHHALFEKGIPLLGSISAGIPLLAEENISERLTFPAEFLSSGEHFALKINGDSMINAGIEDGDIVIVRSQKSAENGDIVAAMIDGETTVKRLFIEEDGLRLQPDNPKYSALKSTDVDVLGKITGLFRRF